MIDEVHSHGIAHFTVTAFVLEAYITILSTLVTYFAVSD